MKEFKEYIKAKIALEKELENTQEMLKQTIKEMLLLRNDNAFNQNANDEMLKAINKN